MSAWPRSVGLLRAPAWRGAGLVRGQRLGSLTGLGNCWTRRRRGDGSAHLATSFVRPSSSLPPSPQGAMRRNQDELKSSLGEILAGVQAAHAAAEATLCCRDEQRFGPKPTLRRIWSLRSPHSIARGWPRFESLQVSAFVQPETRKNHWWLHDRIKPYLGAGPSAVCIGCRGWAQPQGGARPRRTPLAQLQEAQTPRGHSSASLAIVLT